VRSRSRDRHGDGISWRTAGKGCEFKERMVKGGAGVGAERGFPFEKGGLRGIPAPPALAPGPRALVGAHGVRPLRLGGISSEWGCNWIGRTGSRTGSKMGPEPGTASQRTDDVRPSLWPGEIPAVRKTPSIPPFSKRESPPHRDPFPAPLPLPCQSLVRAPSFAVLRLGRPLRLFELIAAGARRAPLQTARRGRGRGKGKGWRRIIPNSRRGSCGVAWSPPLPPRRGPLPWRGSL
jgi:hypothetical protein